MGVGRGGGEGRMVERDVRRNHELRGLLWNESVLLDTDHKTANELQ